MEREIRVIEVNFGSFRMPSLIGTAIALGRSHRASSGNLQRFSVGAWNTDAGDTEASS